MNETINQYIQSKQALLDSVKYPYSREFYISAYVNYLFIDQQWSIWSNDLKINDLELKIIDVCTSDDITMFVTENYNHNEHLVLLNSNQINIRYSVWYKENNIGYKKKTNISDDNLDLVIEEKKIIENRFIQNHYWIGDAFTGRIIKGVKI